MVFMWLRPSSMSLELPSDEMIEERIRHYDSAGRYKEAWPEWRDQMLAGRDVFGGAIPRHPPLPPLPEGYKSKRLYDYERWTTLEHISLGVKDQKSRVQDHGPYVFQCLGPIAKQSYHETTYLLGLEMASGGSPGWAPQFKIRGSIKHCSGYIEWARHIVRTERTILGAVGITNSIILSMFYYGHDTTLLKGILEHWNPRTNTCYLNDEEIFPSLWDMRNVCGFPILGAPYDEYVPDEQMLFGEISCGKFRCSPALKELFYHYHQLFSQHRGIVTMQNWILHFTVLETSSSPDFASPNDPFNVGSENINVQYYDSASPPVISARNVDRKVFIMAFISCWLCYFVIPYRSYGRIRPEVFVMAEQLAEGNRISLAPAALANLFRSLREVCTSSSPGASVAVVPLHLLFGWFNLQFQGLYNVVASDSMRNKLPYLINIAGAIPVRFRDWDARLFFHAYAIPEHERIIFPNKKWLSKDQREYCDAHSGTLSSDSSLLLEFLISIRVGWLPFRSGNRASLEVYNPHRCARQFGYDQTIPLVALEFRHWGKDLFSITECWHLLLRQGTRSSCLIPASNRLPHYGYKYLLWHNMHTKPLLSYKISDIYGSSGKSKKRPPKRSRTDLDIGFDFDILESMSQKRHKVDTSKGKSKVLIEV